MIRLKLLLEDKKTIPNILFVTDRALDRRRSFARKLFSNRKCTGEIRTVDKGSSADLRDFVNLYASPYYDLVVVMCRGIYEESAKSDVDLIKANYEIMISYCHGINVPICIATFPSLQFVDDKFKDKIHFTLADDKKLDRWIQDHADYVLDTGMMTDDVYFEENGVFLNRQAHGILYDEMLDIINKLNISTDSVTDDETETADETDDAVLKYQDRGDDVDELQTLLTTLGYKIKFSELMSKQFGRSTMQAVNKFKQENGLDANDVVDEETMSMIRDAVDDLEQVDVEPKKQESDFSNVRNPSDQDMEMYEAILKGIDAPVTTNTLTFFFAWRDFEAGNAAFNPFNTTQRYNDSIKYNSVGVQHYRTQDDGIEATIKTLKNGRYNDLVSRLKNDESSESIASSADLNIWGSHDGPLRLLKSGRTINPEPIYRIFPQPDPNQSPNV